MLQKNARNGLVVSIGLISVIMTSLLKWKPMTTLECSFSTEE